MKTRTWILVCALLMLACAANAHELMVNRAKIVARDDGHVELSLYLNSVELLHQTLAPEKPLAEFLVACAAMKPDLLAAELTRAEQKLQDEIHLHIASGPELKLVNWSWPSADKLSELIRQQLAMMMVNASNHTHEEQIEVDAEAVGSVDAELKLKLPAEMGRVLVVWYHPKQAWVEAGEWTPVMMRKIGRTNGQSSF